MSSIVARVKALDLPLDKLIVIGSGLLDAYGLRHSSDIDLVASLDLFEKVQTGDEYRLEIRHNDPVLLKEGVEIWQDWGNQSFEQLRADAVEVEGVHFIHPDFLIARKQERGSEKDLQDIQLLKEYLRARK